MSSKYKNYGNNRRIVWATEGGYSVLNLKFQQRGKEERKTTKKIIVGVYIDKMVTLILDPVLRIRNVLHK